MKKITMATLFILFLSFGLFAQATEYTMQDLLDFMQNVPGSHLPEEGQPIKVIGGFFAIEDVNIDGPGMDYLVTYSGTKHASMCWSKLIYIYSENMKTRKVAGFYNNPTFITNDTNITLKYTGHSVPAIGSEGNRIEVPIFIAE